MPRVAVATPDGALISVRKPIRLAGPWVLLLDGVWRVIVRREQIRSLVANQDVCKRSDERDAVDDTYGAALRGQAFASPLQSLLFMDTTIYLPNDGLVKMDRMGMAHGLEVRVPFLNHDLVEYVFAMPDHLKMAGSRLRKVALKAILRGTVLDAVLNARKMGFNAPAAAWLRGPLRVFAGDTLSPESLTRDGLYRAERVGAMLDETWRGRRDHSWALWLVLMTTLWHRRFIGSGAALAIAS